jgi:transcriptional regulator with XRE-family HTH domain/quercetin dioxygenase-like cupin family protein
VQEELAGIATLIRRLRAESRLTLQDLAGKSGVSASTIHKIENHQTSPTIGVLIKIAEGLNCRPGELLAGATGEDEIRLLRHGEQQVLPLANCGWVAPLSAKSDHHMLDVARVHLEAGVGPDEALSVIWQFKGELAILLEAGSLDLAIGDEKFRLNAGDSIHLDTGLPHSWAVHGGDPVQFVCFSTFSEQIKSELSDGISRDERRLPSEVGLETDLVRVASRIRHRRIQQNLTLQRLADKSGVSASTIHKIENNQTSPTVAVLMKVAEGLSLRPSQLLEEVSATDYVGVMREKERGAEFRREAGFSLEQLVRATSGGELDVWRAQIDSFVMNGQEAAALAGLLPDHHCWKFDAEVVILVEDGSVDMTIGRQVFRLDAGDSVHFDANLPHNLIAGGGKPAQAMFLGKYPPGGLQVALLGQAGKSEHVIEYIRRRDGETVRRRDGEVRPGKNRSGSCLPDVMS